MENSRKKFIKQVGLAGIAIGCGGAFSTLLSGCAGIPQIQANASEGRLAVSKSDFAGKNAVIIKNPQLKAPVFLSRLKNGEYSAVLMLCTHKQCEVEHLSNVLYCPCHGSEFTTSGKVMKAPAVKDLLRYETSAEGDKVFIHINH